jgi:tripartite-type tricarboxylate transporter receptor subunit TctC
MAGVKTVHIPYKGTGPALIDLISGQIEMMFSTPVATLPHVRSGKLRSLAMTGAKRSQAVPELPTVAEAALPGFSAEAWYGLLAPAGTPAPVIARLHAEAVKAVQHSDVKTRLGSEGADLIGSTPEQTMQFIQDEIVRWTKVIKAAGIKPE